MPQRAAGRPNALTVDVEDYFQVQALERVVSRDSWDTREVRVERNTNEVLSIFAEAGSKAASRPLALLRRGFVATVARWLEAISASSDATKASVRETAYVQYEAVPVMRPINAACQASKP